MYEPNPTRTRTSLLRAMHGPDELVWRGLDARYRAVIVAFARRRGLGEDAAAEVAQETMAQVVRDYRSGRYERSRGRLRGWILGVAKHRIGDARRSAARGRRRRGESALLGMSDHRRLSTVGGGERERERLILHRALHELRSSPRMSPTTFRAFELLVLREVPAETVAAECSLSVAEVYRVKHRVTKRLRQIVGRLSDS